MHFIGQEPIMLQLGDILPYIYETKKGISILFRGASGYGKTELAKRSANYLVGKDYEYCLGNRITFDDSKWVHLIDEIHLLEKPEILYPIIDEGKYVFIFATNFDSILPEALVNRTMNFIFTEYSDKELIDIFKLHTDLQVSDAVIKYIINISNRNPRIIIKTFLTNLEMRYAKNKDAVFLKSDYELIEEIDRIHGIKDGLNMVARQYLEVLRNLGGTASINLLAAASNLDINTIKYEIEPALLHKKLITISSKGRKLCQQ